MKRLITPSRSHVVALFIASMMLSACGSSASSQSMSGTVAVWGTDALGRDCATGGIGPVVVRDAASKIVGTSTYGKMQMVRWSPSNDAGNTDLDGALKECDYPFTVADLPSGKFYNVSLGGPGEVVKAADTHHVALSLILS